MHTGSEPLLIVRRQSAVAISCGWPCRIGATWLMRRSGLRAWVATLGPGRGVLGDAMLGDLAGGNWRFAEGQR